MKKKSLLLLLIISMVCSGCAKDKIYEDALMGTWNAYSKEQDGKWVDIPNSSDLRMSIIFNSNRTYSVSGYLGNKNGKYHLSKRNIICYVGEQEYMRCYINELWQDICQLEVTLGNQKINIKCRKK